MTRRVQSVGAFVCGLAVVLFLLAFAPTAVAAGSCDKADAMVVACFAAMDRMPALAVVNAKFARRDPSPAQLADARFADADEAAALRFRVTATRPCRELRLAAIRAHRPLLEGAYAILYYRPIRFSRR